MLRVAVLSSVLVTSGLAHAADLVRLTVGATARVGNCFVIEIDDAARLSDVATTEVEVAYSKGSHFDNLTWLRQAPPDSLRVLDPGHLLLNLHAAGMADDLFLPNWLDKILYGEKLAIRFKLTRGLKGETQSIDLSTVLDLKIDPPHRL